MNEELTREVLEAIKNCDDRKCASCPAKCVCVSGVDIVHIALATALLEERAKPKVWDGAPDDAVEVCKEWRAKDSVYLSTSKSYFRELQKTRTRQIAEEIVDEINTRPHRSPVLEQTVETIMRVLNKYAEELEGEA